jgi:hypothetical protein
MTDSQFDPPVKLVTRVGSVHIIRPQMGANEVIGANYTVTTPF